MSTPLAPDLGDAVADYAAGAIDTAEFHAKFNALTVYAVRVASRPAIAAYRIDGTLAAPVFSSLAALARWCVQTADPQRTLGEVGWFATTGADLMTVWPPGADLVIDPGAPGSVRQPARLMRSGDVLTMRARPTEVR